MSGSNNIEQRKKMLEEALNATDNYQKSLKQIEKLNKRLTMAENKSKEVEKLVAENAKLKEINKTLKSSVKEVEKRCELVQNEIQLSLEKTTVLKAEIHKKDMALNKYKTRNGNGNGKGDHIEVEELRHQLHEKDKLVEVLKEELLERERLFKGADSWNHKCSKDKNALLEEIKKAKENYGSADAFRKILSLEEVIADREKDLKAAKDANEQLAVHIYGLEAKVCEIPKLESKIRILEIELASKKQSEFDNLFSKPPPIGTPLLNHSMNIPPPPFAKKVVEAPMQNQLSDLEKQMAAMASEISRLKHYSSNADKFTG